MLDIPIESYRHIGTIYEDIFIAGCVGFGIGFSRRAIWIVTETGNMLSRYAPYTTVLFTPLQSTVQGYLYQCFPNWSHSKRYDMRVLFREPFVTETFDVRKGDVTVFFLYLFQLIIFFFQFEAQNGDMNEEWEGIVAAAHVGKWVAGDNRY